MFRWITNGEQNKQLWGGEVPPQGWKYGCAPRKSYKGDVPRHVINKGAPIGKIVSNF